MKKLLILFLFTVFSFANEKVTLQLKWLHQFQFAGYYAAKEKGFYEELGLDVEIKQRDLKFNNIQQVIDGEAQYGVADSILLLYKAKKEPVVIVSPIFQHSPSVLISLKSSGVDSPYSLDDKKIKFYKNDTDGFALLSMFRKLDVKPKLLRDKQKGDYQKLIDKEIDLLPVYLSNEPFYFNEKNIELNIIDPANYGFDLYGDMLFTSEDEAVNHPNRVKKFKQATLKGWEYALDHKEEIIQLIRNKYNHTKSIEHLRYEAEAIDQVIKRKTVPLGTIDSGRVQYIYELYKDYGLSKNDLDVKGFIFKEFQDGDRIVDLTKEEEEYLKKHPVLRVQNLATFPPFNFNENGKPKGYSVEYLELMAKYLGIKIEFVSNKSFPQFLDMMKDKTLDIIPHLAINEERKRFLDYTEFKHIDYNIKLAVRKGSGITSFNDLKGKKIAILNKSFIHTHLKKTYPELNLVTNPTIGKGLEALALGKVDAVIDNFATMQYFLQKNWLSNIEIIDIKNIGLPIKTSLYMAVSKGNSVLKSILEKTNETIPNNEILKLRQKWMDIKDRIISLTKEEITYLKGKKELKMCIDPDWMPFEKLENGKHVGMSADYFDLVTKAIDTPINVVPTKSWVESLEFGKQRKCDIFSLIMPTTDRKNYLEFTKPYLQIPIIIATKSDQTFISDVTSVLDKKIGVVKGYAFGEILQERYPEKKFILVDSTLDGLERVKSGELFGFIGTLSSVGYHIQKKYIGSLKIAGKFDDTWDLGIGTRNDEPILKDIFNKAIDSISTKQQQDILNKWISVNYHKDIDYTTLWWVSSILITIILLILYNNNLVSEMNRRMERYIKIVDYNVLTSTTDLTGKIKYASQAFCDISGYTKEELIGKPHNIVRHPDTPKELFEELWSNLQAGKSWEGEIKNRRKDGSFYWVYANISPVFNHKNEVIEYTAIRQDITDKKKVEELSITDQLTQLYNRLKLEEAFEQEIERAQRYKHPFSVILLDIDHFKSVNDTYGHDVGDETLKSVANILKESVRKVDIVGRWGGEEFIVIASETSLEDTLVLAEKIRKSIEEFEFKVIGNKTSSFGVSTFNNNDTQESLVKRADEALYVAKENGRNQVTTIEKSTQITN